jgi:hypothetical protein
VGRGEIIADIVIDDPAAATVPAAGLQVAPPSVPVVPAFARPVQTPVGNGRRWWTAFLTLAVLVTAGGLALMYRDDLSFQSKSRDLTTQNQSLQGQNLRLQDQVTAIQGSLSTAQSDLTDVRAQLAHPHLGIWNVGQSLQGPSYYLAAGVPDTFTYHLRLKSTGGMNVSILSFDQFSVAVKCIENGAGDTNWCMHHSGAANSWLGVTSVSYDFHLAEGCAAYMVVITSPGKVTVTPDVSVTYSPAPHATGTCA